MEPKALFGVITRTAGLFCLIYGLWTLAFGVAEAAHILEPQYAREYIFSGLVWLSISALLLLRADAIVTRSYQVTPTDSESNN